MLVSEVKISNYKSIRSVSLSFENGITFLVGKNNAGKTSILECIEGEFSHVPHRSLETAPETTSKTHSQSYVDYEVVVTGAELHAIVRSAEGKVGFLSLNNYEKETLTDQLMSIFKTDQKHTFCFKKPARSQTILKKSMSIDVDTQSKYTLFMRDWENSDVSLKFSSKSGYNANTKDEIGNHVVSKYFVACYRFNAQRVVPGECLFGASQELGADASNLPEVVSNVQGETGKFNKYLSEVEYVIPEVKHLSASASVADGRKVALSVWFHDPSMDRKDLTKNLQDCGTGISQVLAILYAVMSTEQSRVFLIDEPQSFLHPGAAKRLIEVLARYDHHQYIISTHSPHVIGAVAEAEIVQVRKEGFETKVSKLDRREVSDMKNLLDDVGVRLSDVFGADRVLWVEGKTEEKCFPLILRHFGFDLGGTEIIAVSATGDLYSPKKQKITLDIYNSLSAQKSIIPRTIAIVLDAENKDEIENQKIIKLSNKLISFIPKPMFENYLLNAAAIQELLQEKLKGSVCIIEIQRFLSETKESWNGAKQLEAVVEEFCGEQHRYDKVRDGLFLTKSILRANAAMLRPLYDFLEDLFREREESVK